MKYPEFLSSARRHNHACRVLEEKLDNFEDEDQNTEEFKYLVLSLYYLAGYIIECSIKYKIFELSSFGTDLEVNEEECAKANIDYKKRIKTHSFTKLQDHLDSLISDLSHVSEKKEINKLLSGWNPEVRYSNSQLNHLQVKEFYKHTKKFLIRM